MDPTLRAEKYLKGKVAVEHDLRDRITEMVEALCRELNGSEPASTERCKRIACEELQRQRKTVLVDEAALLGWERVTVFRRK